MKKILSASVVALALVGSLPAMRAAFASDFDYAEQANTASVDIGRIHSVLRLNAQQEALWGPVESALRNIARQQQARAEQGGFVHRISHRVVSIVLNGVAVERLAMAARPLIAALSDEQKQTASGLAQEMGLGPMVMAALK